MCHIDAALERHHHPVAEGVATVFGIGVHVTAEAADTQTNGAGFVSKGACDQQLDKPAFEVV